MQGMHECAIPVSSKRDISAHNNDDHELVDRVHRVDTRTVLSDKNHKKQQEPARASPCVIRWNSLMSSLKRLSAAFS
jgi:hypothetical protein